MVTIVKGKREFDKMPTINETPIVPAGGSADQVLTKDSGSDYEYSWQDAQGGGDGHLAKFYLYADQWDVPLNSDWAVNSYAPLARDTNNNALLVRRFDDTTEEYVGILLRVPDTATNLQWRVISRAETAPGSTQTVITRFYKRAFPDNGAVESWTTPGTFSLTVPNNELWQYDTFSDTLSNLGITAGRQYQFEYGRDADDGSDNLSGDWTLLAVEVTFT